MSQSVDKNMIGSRVRGQGQEREAQSTTEGIWREGAVQAKGDQQSSLGVGYSEKDQERPLLMQSFLVQKELTSPGLCKAIYMTAGRSLHPHCLRSGHFKIPQ